MACASVSTDARVVVQCRGETARACEVAGHLMRRGRLRRQIHGAPGGEPLRLVTQTSESQRQC